MEPTLLEARALAVRALLLAGRFQECTEISLGPYEAMRAACFWGAGAHDAARHLADSVAAWVRTQSRSDSVYTVVPRAEGLATFYAMSGDPSLALRWIEFAYDQSPLGVLGRVLESGLFDRLRRDPESATRVQRLTQSVWARVEGTNVAPETNR